MPKYVKNKIKKEDFEYFLSQNYSKRAISAIMGVGINTLYNWIKDNYDGKSFLDVKQEILKK